MDKEKELRKWLLKMLLQENAHAGVTEAVENLSISDLEKTSKGMPYNAWQLLEHIRISQWDIVEFCSNPNHISPDWPNQYWPDSSVPLNESQFRNTLKTIQKDKEKMISLIRENPLLDPFPWAEDKCLFREAILLLDHTSYHTGQLILVRKLTGTWKV